MVLGRLTENIQKNENRNRNFEIEIPKQTMDSVATVHVWVKLETKSPVRHVAPDEPDDVEHLDEEWCVTEKPSLPFYKLGEAAYIDFECHILVEWRVCGAY